MSSISNAMDGFQASWSALQSDWEQTREQWNDAVGTRFEREFWSEWESMASPLLQALDQLDRTLEQALAETDPGS